MTEPLALEDAFIPELPSYYRGKVRENYDLPDGRRILISTDRLSAFPMERESCAFLALVDCTEIFADNNRQPGTEGGCFEEVATQPHLFHVHSGLRQSS